MGYYKSAGTILTTGVIGATTISDATNFFPTLQITPLPNEVLKILSVSVYNNDAAAAAAYVSQQTTAAAAGGAAAAGAPVQCLLHKGLNLTESDVNRQVAYAKLNSIPTNGSRIALDGLTTTSVSFEFDTDGTADGAGVYYILTTGLTLASVAAAFVAKVNSTTATTGLKAGLVNSYNQPLIRIYDNAGLCASSQTPLSSKTGGDSSTSITLTERNRVVNFTNAGASPVNPTLKFAAPKHARVFRLATKATMTEQFDAFDSCGIELDGGTGDSLGIAFGSAVVVDIQVRMQQMLKPT